MLRFCLVRSQNVCPPQTWRPIFPSAIDNLSAHTETSSLNKKDENAKLSENNSASSGDTNHNPRPLNNDDKASLDHLLKIEERIREHAPYFFSRPIDFSYYTQDIMFINNMRGTKTQNLANYAIQLNSIKIYHLIRYSSTKVELLNLVKNPEESYLRIRWRFVCKPGLIRFAMNVFKFSSTEFWTDGLSTLHVNRDGKVYCHVCDNIDMDLNEIGPKPKNSLKNPLIGRGVNV